MEASDVKRHADAMERIRNELAPFRSEDRVVIVAGVLGNALSECGDEPSRVSAVMWLGQAFEMALDMIHRNFPEN